jgi:2-methylcitrate dehydratase PrpD
MPGGPPRPGSSPYGLYATFADLHDVNLEAQVGDLGERWETPRIAFKPYPACHFVHSPIDAALQAIGGRKLSPEEVREIVVAVPEPAIPIVLEPLAAKISPKTPYDAKFSLPYATAVMLAHGRVTVDSFTEKMATDPAVLALARKVRYEKRDFPTYPKAYPGAARVALTDGGVFEAEVPYQRGGPENPMSADDVREKFRANAALALDSRDLRALEESILTVERRDDLRGSFAPLRRARPTAK